MNNNPSPENPGTSPVKEPGRQQPPRPGDPVPPPDQPDIAPPSEPIRQPPQYTSDGPRRGLDYPFLSSAMP
jgi:hypothetical protein